MEPADLTSESPESVAVRNEVKAIMTEESNPMHAGYLRNDPTVNDHITNLYKGLYKNTPDKLVLRDSMSVRSKPQAQDEVPTSVSTSDESTPESRGEQAQAEYRLRNLYGDDYDDVMHHARVGIGHIFASEEQFREVLNQHADDLGPEAEALLTRFLSDFGRLVVKQKGVQP